jgi:hypothetical protein
MAKKSKFSPAQRRAFKKFQQAGTKAAARQMRKQGPTRAQHKAMVHNAALGRRAQAQARAGHQQVRQKPKAKLSPGDVSCCGAEAIAASLRLMAGTRVSDEEMLELYWRVAAGPDDGAHLPNLLEAVAATGLAGWYPSFWPVLSPQTGTVLNYYGWEHAVTLCPSGSVLSWREHLPWPGPADEMWALSWHR